ncbi:hypothetical protein HY251_02320 [bacterium]|nr:hypothetical protein [bacterium]
MLAGLGAASGGGVSPARPTERAYALSLERALAEARVGFGALGYFEAHGSGDPLEDALEAEALVRASGEASERSCALGSAKAVIGHAGAAAGLASLVKTSSCVFRGVLPPLPGLERPRRALTESPALHVPREPLAWVRDRALGPRRAAVASISTDGSCLHAILEGVERKDAPLALDLAGTGGEAREAILAVLANDTRELATGLERLSEHARSSDAGVAALAGSWLEREGNRPERELACALVARDRSELARGIEAALEHVRAADHEHDHARSRPSQAELEKKGAFLSLRPVGRKGEIAFVFPGSGACFPGMGRGLALGWPGVVSALDRESERLASQLMSRWHAPHALSWEKGWEERAARELAEDPRRAIMGQVMLGVLASDVLRRSGIEPRAAIGYSLGESTALFSLRAWRGRDEMLARMRPSHASSRRSAPRASRSRASRPSTARSRARSRAPIGSSTSSRRRRPRGSASTRPPGARATTSPARARRTRSSSRPFAASTSRESSRALTRTARGPSSRSARGTRARARSGRSSAGESTSLSRRACADRTSARRS